MINQIILIVRLGDARLTSVDCKVDSIYADDSQCNRARFGLHGQRQIRTWTPIVVSH